jgi:hypothetical protein
LIPSPDWLAPRGPINIWIAVDASPYQIHLVLVSDGFVLGAFEATTGPRQAARVIHYIRNTVPPGAQLKLVGRYYDRWPQSLSSQLVMEFGPVTWINPTLLRGTLPEVARLHKLFKTYRALFYAICAQEGATRPLSPFFDRFDLLHAWKIAVFNDLQAHLGLGTSHLSR